MDKGGINAIPVLAVQPWKGRGFLFLIALIVVTCLGCSESVQLLPQGRCRVNEDCSEGNACRNTYCEDIYHPRKDIKPY